MTKHQPRSGQQTESSPAADASASHSAADRSRTPRSAVIVSSPPLNPSSQDSASQSQSPTSAEVSPIASATATPTSQVLITPRIVDQGAFDALSRVLHQTVREAGRQSSDLRAAIAQASRLTTELRNAELNQNENIELAAAALKRIDERAAQVEATLNKFISIPNPTVEFEKQSESILSRKIDVFEARLEAVIAAATARVDALEHRLAGVSSRLEDRVSEIQRDASASMGPSITRLTAICERAQALIGKVERLEDSNNTTATEGSSALSYTQGSLGELVSRAETLKNESAFATRQFDQIRQQADQARKILGESLNDMCTMIDRLTERADGLRAQSEHAKSVAEQIRTEIDAKAESVRSQTDEMLSQIKPLTSSSCDELRALISEANELTQSSTLGTHAAQTAVDDLRRLLTQIEPWQHLLIAKTDSGEHLHLPAPIQNILDVVRTEIRDELSAIARALSDAALRTSRTADSIKPQPADSDADALSQTSPNKPVRTDLPLGVTIPRISSTLSVPVTRINTH